MKLSRLRKIGVIALIGLTGVYSLHADPPGTQSVSGGGRGIYSSSLDLFNSLSKGKDVLIREELDERGKAIFDRIAASLKVSDGVLTRQQYVESANQFQANRAKGFTPGTLRSIPPPPADRSLRPQPKKPDLAAERPPVTNSLPSFGNSRSRIYPKELPAWFIQLDTDEDGQIGLYEWKHSGRSFAEFKQMDRNGDNFLTADEVLFFLKSKSRD